MRSKGSRFTLGVWGLRVCLLDVAFMVATVRNRSQPSAWGPYGRACGKFCRGGHFWKFQTSRCFVSHGRRGTSWHSDVFCNESRFLCGRRNTFATFSEDVLHFSWQAQHFGRVHRHFSWEARHFRCVVLRVFCQSHWQGCVKWRQGANSVAGVAFCAMCWKMTEASHETSILRCQISQVMFSGDPLLRISRSKAWFLNSVLEKYSKCRDQIRAPKNQISEWPCPHYITQHYATLITLHYTTATTTAATATTTATTWHYSTLHPLHYTTLQLQLHYFTLHYTKLQYTTLQYTTPH